MVYSGTLQKFLHAAALWLGLSTYALAGEVTVAVASNFLTTAQVISVKFKADTGHSVRLVNGSTGTLYAQIIKGAPYDVFLSADRARIIRLEAAGKLIEGARKPYAIGTLVLYVREEKYLKADVALSLNSADIRHFAMADPELAPYGRAANEVLESLQLLQMIETKAVRGANIGQTFNFVQTGNAQIGFVALAQAMMTEGVWLDIPATLYSPVVQEAGLLKRSAGNKAALAFYDYLSGDSAQAIIRASGYGVMP